MPSTQKPSMEDAIEMVKLCHRHTKDELANNHAHTVATVESSHKLLLGALEYDISHASDHQNKTDDPIYRHVQKASGSKREGPEPGDVKRKSVSRSQDTSKKEQASVPVRSQKSTTATTTTTASHASTRAPQGPLDLPWRGPKQPSKPQPSATQEQWRNDRR